MFLRNTRNQVNLFNSNPKKLLNYFVKRTLPINKKVNTSRNINLINYYLHQDPWYLLILDTIFVAKDFH